MEEKEVVSENDLNKPKKKKNKKKIILIIIAIIVILLGLVCAYLFYFKDKFGKSNEVNVQSQPVNSPYKITGNALDTFDLAFLKLENDGKNMIYSPLSIKYALEMLSEGTAGESKAQIDAVIGDYVAKTYTNSKNMSFANALFVRDTFKDSINQEYVNNLTSKFNASVVYDSFANSKTINKWVSDKTLKLIDNLVTDDNVKELDFALINALAIDQEWVKTIKPEKFEDEYEVHFAHERLKGDNSLYDDKTYYNWNHEFQINVASLESDSYQSLNFNNDILKAKSVDIAAVANKYDIISEIGEDKIKKDVAQAYEKYLKAGDCGDNAEPDSTEKVVKEYLNEIKKNYKHVSSSTDFSFYDDDNVKVFAKDLKTYSNTTLQYVGIMPKKTELKTYIENTDSKEISNIIEKIKPIELDSFDDKMITYIHGYIPMFKFERELDLISDLKKIGITDVFDKEKADLSKMTSAEETYMKQAKHKSNIEFSNEGIKAAATTEMGGAGNTGCGFDYLYEIPYKEIDLTFNKPYLFLIRDKSTGEIWFTGSVYEPTEYQEVQEP